MRCERRVASYIRYSWVGLCHLLGSYKVRFMSYMGCNQIPSHGSATKSQVGTKGMKLLVGMATLCWLLVIFLKNYNIFMSPSSFLFSFYFLPQLCYDRLLLFLERHSQSVFSVWEKLTLNFCLKMLILKKKTNRTRLLCCLFTICGLVFT